MKRVRLLLEGQSEYEFIKSLLLEHFYAMNLQIEPIILVTGTDKVTGGSAKGGVSNYAKIKKDINEILHDCRAKEVWASTLFDLYRLPSDFPGKSDAPLSDPYKRVEHLEQAFLAECQDRPNGRCLIPYIQLHELEALLLCDVDKFEQEFFEKDQLKGIQNLKTEVAAFESPELINEGATTSPSKRIIRHLPAYERRKRSASGIIASAIGLPKMRQLCPHFNSWITQLEALARE